jgi:hypothetical protein
VYVLLLIGVDALSNKLLFTKTTLSFLETYHDAIPDSSLHLSAEDMTTFASTDSTFEESRKAIKEGNTVLSETASTPTGYSR